MANLLNRSWKEWTALFVLSLSAPVLIFTGTSWNPVSDGDEALYGQVAREMSETRSWWTPRYWGKPFLHKPPLKYWLIQAAGQLTGNELRALRLSAGLAALATLALLVWVGRNRGHPLAGWSAAFLLLGNHQWLLEHGARTGSMDSEAALLATAALVLGLMGPGARNPGLFRAGSAVAVAALLMLKSALGVLPLVVLIPLLVREGKREARSYLVWLGVSLAILVLPWHLGQALLHPEEFWEVYVGYELIGRVEANISPYQGRFMGLLAFGKGFLPFTPLVAASGLAFLFPGLVFPRGQYRLRRGGDRGKAQETLPFLGATIFTLLFPLFLIFLEAQWAWHIMPALPAAALMAGFFLEKLWRARHRTWARIIGIGMVLGIAAPRLFLLRVDPRYGPDIRPSFLWPMEASLYRMVDFWELAQPEFLLEVSVLGLLILVFGALWWAWKGRPVSEGCTRRSLIAPLAMFFLVLLWLRVAGDEAIWVFRSSPEDPAMELVTRLQEKRPSPVHLLGFIHVGNYGGRLGPLDTWYLGQLGLDRLVDHYRDLSALTKNTGGAAEGRPGGGEILLWSQATLPVEEMPLELLRRLARRYDLYTWPILPAGSPVGWSRFLPPEEIRPSLFPAEGTEPAPPTRP